VSCKWEVGGTSRIITGDSGTLGLDNLELEVAGEASSLIAQYNTTLITLY